MQSTIRALRRSYATHVPAHKGRVLSAPMAVRERRAARGLDKDTNDDRVLTPSEFAYYKRSLALGNLRGQGKNGGEPSAKEWFKQLNDRRNRIRGIQIETQKNGQKKVVAVGQKIYLPNIIFRLVRNHTPPDMPYNPYEATFRIPQSVTKTDVRSYLLSVYGVKTTYIRTDNYISPIFRARDTSWTRTKSHKTYKRAVVGLVEPFEPPADIEALPNAQTRIARQQYNEESFQIQAVKNSTKVAYLRMKKKGTWRNIKHTGRGQILKAIADARWKREHTLMATKSLMDEARADGRPLDKIDGRQMGLRASEERESFEYHSSLAGRRIRD